MFTKLQKSTGDKIDVAEQITCYQMVHQPSVILLDHLVPNKLVHAVLNMVIVEVLQLIVNVPTALTIEQVISQIFTFTHIWSGYTVQCFVYREIIV